MPTRDRKGTMPDHWREKIRTGNLLTRLQKCAMGEIEMTPVQVRSAEILLRKTLPDMKVLELNETRPVVRIIDLSSNSVGQNIERLPSTA